MSLEKIGLISYFLKKNIYVVKNKSSEIKSVPVIFVVNLFYYCGSFIDFEEFLFPNANLSCQKL